MPAAQREQTSIDGIDQAVILAGGKGTRLRPYTERLPKAMVPVAGAPILGYQLAWLAEQGVKHVVLSLGHRAEAVRGYVGDGTRFGLEVTYVVEEQPLGRGGGLKLAARHLPAPGAPCYALNGDVITRFSLGGMAAHHRTLGVAATVALAPYRSNWGVADLDGDLIRRFVQSPRLPYWINAGVYLLEPEVLGILPDQGDHEDSTFPAWPRRAGWPGTALTATGGGSTRSRTLPRSARTWRSWACCPAGSTWTPTHDRRPARRGRARAPHHPRRLPCSTRTT